MRSAPTRSSRPRSPPAPPRRSSATRRPGVISIETKTGGHQVQRNPRATRTTLPPGLPTSVSTGSPAGSADRLASMELTFYVSGTLSGQQSIPTGKGADNLQIVPAGRHRHHGGRPRIERRLRRPPGAGAAVRPGHRRLQPVQLEPQYRNREQLRRELPGRPSARRPPAPISGLGQAQLQPTAVALGISLSGLRSQDRADLPRRTWPSATGVLPTLTNPQDVFGFRNWSNVVTLNWTQQLTKSTERALALEYLSLISAGPDHHVAPLSAGRATAAASEPVRRIHDRRARLPVQLRQLPDQRRADQQLPDQRTRAAAGGRSRLGGSQPLHSDLPVPHQSLRHGVRPTGPPTAGPTPGSPPRRAVAPEATESSCRSIRKTGCWARPTSTGSSTGTTGSALVASSPSTISTYSVAGADQRAASRCL